MAEVAEKDRILRYVKGLDFTKIDYPIDYEEMAYDLNITNPIVRDLLEIWVEMRCRRMDFVPRVMKKLTKIKRQLDKF